MMKKKKIPWRITTSIMFLVCILTVCVMFSNGLMDEEGSVILNVATGAMGMLGVVMLSLAYSMDHAAQDESSVLFYILLIITYVGILTDNFSRYVDGKTDLIWLNQILCFISYILSAVIAPIFMAYQRVVFSIKERNRLFKWVIFFMFVDIVFLIVAMATGNLFIFDENGQFHMHPGHYLAGLYPFFVFVICIVDNVRQKMEMRKRLALLAFNLTPMAGLFTALYIDYGIAYVTLMFALMLMYFTVQMERSIKSIEREKKLAEQSRDLLEKQTQIMMSQIQPHFIYNTLGSISSLCIDNPELAADVTDQFARYLRGNMAYMKNGQLIPFEKELEHTSTYLWIEKIRFADYLNIVYNVTCTDFVVPPLTLQPLVENAVKHGITPKEEGGTVTIDAHEKQDSFVIMVSDDGMGYETDEPSKDGKLHVGIENVRKRLEILCRGSLEINSNVGVGTVVTVTIPKGEK